MPEEVIREFPLRGKQFSREYQPEPGLAGKGRRMQTQLRDTFLTVFDRLGAEAWLQQFVQRSDENARVYVNGLLRMMPLELQANVDSTLIVKVVTQLGTTEVNLGRKPPPNRESAAQLPALPVAPVGDCVPRDPK